VSQRARIALFLAVVFVVVGGVTAYVVTSATSYQRKHDRPPSVAIDDDPAVATTGPRIDFRHTGIDDHIGLVATVPLDDPGGPRAFTDVACDRVDATAGEASCLRTERGVVTKFSLTEYDADWQPVEKVALPGIPSRTRLSSDGTLVSSTTFVSGHTYMQVGFSTATEIRDVGGSSHGNLEKFDLVLHGKAASPRDRNIWGVTFADDDNTFYATVGTGGETYLVRGDLASSRRPSATARPGGRRRCSTWRPVSAPCSPERPATSTTRSSGSTTTPCSTDSPATTSPASPTSGSSTPTPTRSPSCSSSRPGRPRWCDSPQPVAACRVVTGPRESTNERSSPSWLRST
jgi:hypothetical protein